MDAKQGSPLWWLEKLLPQHAAQVVEVARYERYYDGRQTLPLALSSGPYRERFREMVAAICDNWLPLVVDAVEERMHVEGFRLGQDSAADVEAREIWQRNHLDTDSELVHNQALQAGRAAVMVWAGKDGEPEITPEHPGQVYVAYETGSRWRRQAAVKSWVDEWTGRKFANLYLPNEIWKFESGNGTSWQPVGQPLDNPLGVVPIVEFRNRPKIAASVVRSEIAEVLSTQDQINKLVCDMIVSSEFGAFRQRYAIGVEAEIDEETGKEKTLWNAGQDRVWTVGNDEARFGEFDTTDLGNYIKAIENRVQSLASRSRTPAHYMLGQSGSFPSGESLRAAETGLVTKTRSRMRHYGESWEEAIRLAFLVKSDTEKASAALAETIWSDPESRTESEHIDSVVKLLALKVPLRKLWERAGFSQAEIDMFRSMLAEEALLTGLATPAGFGAGNGVPDLDPADELVDA